MVTKDFCSSLVTQMISGILRYQLYKEAFPWLGAVSAMRNDSNISAYAGLLGAAPEISLLTSLAHVYIYHNLLQFSLGKTAISSIHRMQSPTVPTGFWQFWQNWGQSCPLQLLSHVPQSWGACRVTAILGTAALPSVLGMAMSSQANRSPLLGWDKSNHQLLPNSTLTKWEH